MILKYLQLKLDRTCITCAFEPQHLITTVALKMEIELEVFVLSIFIHHSMDMIRVKGGNLKGRNPSIFRHYGN